MIRLHSRVCFAAIAAGALLAATHAQAVPVFVDYDVAASGQSARAGFEFRDDSTLQISLFETTPAGASSLTGGNAILTSLGFLLPRVQIAGGSVAVAPGSASAGFEGGEILGGANISNLWGYTPTTLPVALQDESAELAIRAAAQLQIAAEQDQIAAAKRERARAERNTAALLLGNNPDAQMRADAQELIRLAEQDEAAAAAAEATSRAATDQAGSLQSEANELTARALSTPSWQFVGALWNPLTAFLASLPGTSFDGLDGGLLGDALAHGSEAVIINSALLSLTLSDALLATEQADFLSSLLTGSSIGYGKGGFVAAGTPRGGPGQPPVAVAEPSMFLLAIAALFALALTTGRACFKMLHFAWHLKLYPRALPGSSATCSGRRRSPFWKVPKCIIRMPATTGCPAGSSSESLSQR